MDQIEGNISKEQLCSLNVSFCAGYMHRVRELGGDGGGDILIHVMKYCIHTYIHTCLHTYINLSMHLNHVWISECMNSKAWPVV